MEPIKCITFNKKAQDAISPEVREQMINDRIKARQEYRDSLKSVDAEINLAIVCECPHCEYDNNLLDMQEMTDDGMIYQEALSDPHWGKKGFCKTIACESCGVDFLIQNINH